MSYICPECDKAYCRLGALLRHVASVHLLRHSDRGQTATFTCLCGRERYGKNAIVAAVACLRLHALNNGGDQGGLNAAWLAHKLGQHRHWTNWTGTPIW